ncbi:MAG: PrkA family serine protein kinase, partial [Pseudomonadales bacterium]|nr:PrkA family serine protein kinase [Pseudomonadales bacterium]
MSIFSHYQNRYEETQQEEYTLQEYLDICKNDPSAYASAPERMLAAIGEPELIDTSLDPRLSRIFSNKIIRRYPAFSEFYGMEECIEQIVSYFRHAAQGLEEKKQILYLLGPVGGGKSSLAERLKHLIEKIPFYAIKDSPVNESPLNLFSPEEDGNILEEEYGIPGRYLKGIMSPWAVKRLHEFNGDISKFKVVKLYPSILDQIGVAKTEPGDENNQDISTLVGKVDIRKLEEFAQNDPDCYAFSGGLCKANQGLLEFVEMFKAPIKVLHPLLTATQEGNYNSTEGMGAI